MLQSELLRENQHGDGGGGGGGGGEYYYTPPPRLGLRKLKRLLLFHW